MYCSVILRGAVRETDRQYTYKIPEDLETKVVPGSFCNVPFGFGNKTRTAVVTAQIPPVRSAGDLASRRS